MYGQSKHSCYLSDLVNAFNKLTDEEYEKKQHKVSRLAIKKMFLGITGKKLNENKEKQKIMKKNYNDRLTEKQKLVMKEEEEEINDFDKHNNPNPIAPLIDNDETGT